MQDNSQSRWILSLLCLGGVAFFQPAQAGQIRLDQESGTLVYSEGDSSNAISCNGVQENCCSGCSGQGTNSPPSLADDSMDDGSMDDQSQNTNTQPATPPPSKNPQNSQQQPQEDEEDTDNGG